MFNSKIFRIAFQLFSKWQWNHVTADQFSTTISIFNTLINVKQLYPLNSLSFSVSHELSNCCVPVLHMHRVCQEKVLNIQNTKQKYHQISKSSFILLLRKGSYMGWSEGNFWKKSHHFKQNLFCSSLLELPNRVNVWPQHMFLLAVGRH